MENETSSFRKLPTREAAEALQELLLQNGIEAYVSDDENEFERLYLGSLTKSFYEVQIAPADFPKANQVVAEAELDEVASVDKSYYLYDYPNQELLEVIEKYDEWSAFDVEVAKKILGERGTPMDENALSSMKYKRLDELAQPEKVGTGWLAAGYIAAFTGGILGLIFGYTIMKATKVLPDGNKVYTYTSKDRAHGKTIFYIGLIILPLALIGVMMRSYIINRN